MDLYNLRIKETIDNFGFYMFKNPNIVGVGRGVKVINGYRTNIPALTFYVAKKLYKNSINSTDIIPKTIKGISTDVIESGYFTPYSNNNFKNTNTDILGNPSDNRPALGGGCVMGIDKDNSKSFVSATLTYAFTDKKTKANIYFLTSEHFAKKLRSNASIFYSKRESFDKEAWVIGTVHKVSLPTFDPKLNQPVFPIDAALCIVGRNNEATKANKIRPGLLNGKIITESQTASLNDKVYKYGLSTGITSGVVTTLDTTLKISNKYIKDQIIVQQKSSKGDSGALGVIESTGKSFGMLNGGNDIFGLVYYSNIHTVLDYFDIEFLI